MPTDIDGVIDYHDKAFLFLEYKHKDTPLSVGQRICFERLVKHIQETGRASVLIVAEHDVENTLDDVKAGECLVRSVFHGDRWVDAPFDITVKDYVERFIKKYG